MRKHKVVDVLLDGRDKGKRFYLTEMPPIQAEKWAARALLALTSSGVDIPENIAGAGLAGVAVLGFQALGRADFQAIEPLMDEMMQCVKIIPDPSRPEYKRTLNFPPPGDDDSEADIEELTTLGILRMEVFELHVGFSIRDVLSRAQETARTTTIPGSGDSLTSRISQDS